MRISTHGNDLLITDQSLGFGAALLSIGILLVVSCIDRLISAGSVSSALFSGACGLFAIKLGLARLMALQLIVDLDERLVITRRWSFMMADTQRIPFDAIDGFHIVPDDKDNGTRLMIKTTRGPVPAAGDLKAARAAWQEVITAVEAHMQR